MHQKGFITVILAFIIAALISAGAYFVATKQAAAPAPVADETSGSAPAPSPVPEPPPESEPTAIPGATSESPQMPGYTPPDEDGVCPSGYVHYGMPFGCVPPEYMEYCRTHMCPL